MARLYKCPHCGSDMFYFHWKGCPELELKETS